MTAGFRNSNMMQMETSSLVQSLVEGKELEKWQRCICDVLNIYTCCVDGRGTPLTPLYGRSGEVEKIKKAIDREQLQDMLLRVSESTLEDQAVEETAYSNFRMGVISVKVNGKPIINWLIFGVISDAVKDSDDSLWLSDMECTIQEKEFYRIADVLRDVSEEMIRYKRVAMDAQAETRRSKFSEIETKAALQRTETLAEIVQLLESDDSAEVVMQKVLKSVGEYLGISTANVLRPQKSMEAMDVLAVWCGEGIPKTMDSNVNQNVPFFVRTDKPLIISGNAVLKEEEKQELDKYGIKSVIVIPIMINGAINMYATFAEMSGVREWQVEEIKFVNDAVKILQSILVKRIQKNSLAGSYASLEIILDNVGCAVYVQNKENRSTLFANYIMRHTFEEELKDGSIRELLEKGNEESNNVREMFVEKNEHWYEVYSTVIKWVDGNPVRLYALYDITEKKVYQKRIEQQAYTDFLTGLYNRMCCERDLAKYVDEAYRKKVHGALLYLDLDDFKHINDALGHQYGDALLKSISNSLGQINGIQRTCYRMGGDEFVIVIPPSEYGNLDGIVEAIKDVFAKPWFLKDTDYYCTMSMGMVVFPDAGSEVHDLIKKADIAMYEAKKHGKNRIAQYSDNIESKSGKRLDMEKNMRDATVTGYREFEVYFQPIIDVQKEGKPCTGAEALIRWNSTELGFIPPSEFIPLAEYLGLINPIGNYVLREACYQCKKWNDNGYPDYKVNVNLSVVQLLQADIVDIVEKTIHEVGINPHNLTLEVTESLAINDMERMKEILGSIKKLGVRIALDDFGTGYSSLNHIREIPFDVIKVDQSFIKDLEKDEYAKSFIKMVSELAEAIGVNLCVEGVETKSQYDILSDMRVNLVQGYYFDRPMQLKAFEEKYVPMLK